MLLSLSPSRLDPGETLLACGIPETNDAKRYERAEKSRAYPGGVMRGPWPPFSSGCPAAAIGEAAPTLRDGPRRRNVTPQHREAAEFAVFALTGGLRKDRKAGV